MKLEINKVKRIRDVKKCSIQAARHIYIKKDLLNRLKNPCTTDDLRHALNDIVTHGNITFI